jgi:uncharacterized protein
VSSLSVVTTPFESDEMTEAFLPGKRLVPAELVVLQGTSFCNLNCKYCDLSVESRRTKSVMEPKLIERFFTELFNSGLCAREVTVLWHSGEPLTLPPAYYEEAISLILGLRDRLASDDVSVKFGIQTNGVLIDEDWCRFFKRHEERLSVGVSCDGPSDLHDLYRLNWNERATHRRTIHGMDLLHKNGIKYKVIAVVTRNTLRQPGEFYDFFFGRREQLSGFHFNILAEGNSSDPNLAYSAEDRTAYYLFYRRILELNRKAGREFEVLNFSQAVARIVSSKGAGSARFFEEASAPLKALNLDVRGNVTTFYAGLSIDTLHDLYGDGKGLSLGNIFEVSFEDMIRSEKLRRIMQDFTLSARACETSCEYFSVCSGGFDILKKQKLGTFEAGETVECVIHVKALVDAVLDDIGDHLELQASN